MIVTIHQPEHMPWLGFFDKMRQADIFVLLDTTQFAKDDFQNRNRIKTAQGPGWLTVPVYKKGRSVQMIRETEICNERNWRNRCWSLIEQNYRQATCFAEYRSLFAELYHQQWQWLVEFNISIIRGIAGLLGITTEIVTASELGVYEQGATRVNFAICQALSASVYLSGQHGLNYLDETPFREHNIDVRYQQFQHPVYPQIGGAFLSHMSAIDLLFNCGAASREILSKGQPAPKRAELAGSAEGHL